MDDVDEELTQLAIRHALERYRYYFEMIDPQDRARAEQLGRLGRAVAEDLEAEVGIAVGPRRFGGGIQVCMTLIRTPFTPEPA